MKTLYVFGDSVGRGVTVDAATGRYTLYRENLTGRLRKAGVNVRDRTKIGATVRDGVQLFETEDPGEGSVCLIGYGGNDSAPDWDAAARDPESPYSPCVPLDEYGEKLLGIIKKAKAKGADVLLSIPVPVCAKKYFRGITGTRDGGAILRFLGDVERIARSQQMYALASYEAARLSGADVLDMRTPFLLRRDMEDLFCDDGIHPTREGYDMLADAFCPALLKVCGAQA